MKMLFQTLIRTANILKFHTAMFILLIGVGNAWGYDPHFYLTGETPTGSWSNSATAWFLVSPANDSYDEYCTYMWLSENDYFGLNNGTKRYSRTDNNDQDIKDGQGSGQFGYPGDNSQSDKAFKYVGATGLVRINVSEADFDCSGCREYYPWVWVNEGLEIDILKGEKVMFYFGSSTNKGEHNWLYLSTTSKTSHNASEQYHRLNETKCTSYISVAYVDAGVQYYISDYDSWGGMQMEENAVAGSLYSIYQYNGEDKIYRNEGSIPHFTTTTVNKTVGATDSEIAAAVENSIYGNEQVLYYYYTTDGGTTFTKFDPSDISGLAVGVYSVYALGWDGHILVRSENSVTLNIGVTITLDANGGTDGDATSVFATSGVAASTGNIAAASLPTKTGYTFNGFWTSGGIEVIDENGEWITNVSGYTNNSGNWTCSTASTLYAHWTPKNHTVTLVGMEADTDEPIQVNVTYDAVLSIVSPHTKAHYDFGGYWTDNNDTGATLVTQIIDANGNWIKDIAGYTGHSGDNPTWVRDTNTSLFAKWTEHSYTITTTVSPTGAGTLSCGSSITAHYVTPSDLITATANPAWNFVRWEYSTNVGPATGTGLDNTVQINATVNGTLTAVFEPRFCLVGSIWDDSGNGGMPGWGDFTADFIVNSYTNLTTMNLTCARELDPNTTYKFQVHDKVKGQNLGYATDNTFIGNSSLLFNTQNKDVMLRVNGHGVCTFTISALTSGDLYPTVSAVIPASHQMNLEWAYVRINGDWYKTSDAVGGTVSAQTTESGHHFAIHNGEYVAHGGAITYSATPATGYMFDGWYNTDYNNKFSTTNPYTSSNIQTTENVEAKFVEKSATVILATNNSRGGSITVDVGAVDWGSSTTAGVTTKKSLVVTENTGYNFTGWTLSATPDFELQDKASETDKEVTLAGLGGTDGSSGTLTANFSAKTYTVTLNDDQGGEHNGTATATFDATSLSVTTHATIDGWMRLGYWNTDGNKVTDSDGNLEANVTSYTSASNEWKYDNNVTLYAHWYRILTLDKNGGTTDGTIGVDYKGTTSSLSVPTRSGYSIEGFYAEAGCVNKVMNTDGTLVNCTGYVEDGKWINKTVDRLYTKWIFIIYRSGDKADDPRTQSSAIESYAGGTISDVIEYRMKVHTLDQWYSLCLPFTVNAVKVWDDEDGEYYDIVPYYRSGGKFYNGHYIIRTPQTTTDYQIATFEEDWLDPSNNSFMPAANIPYIIQWHDNYFLGKYISFLGAAGQTIPSEFTTGSAPTTDNVVNVYGNNTMHSGTVRDAYMLDKDYGSSGAWMREDIGTNRTINPFECYIIAKAETTARYRIIHRDMVINDTPTGLKYNDPQSHKSVQQIKVYTITGILMGDFNDCSFADVVQQMTADYPEGIYILRSNNESMKLMLGEK